MGGLVSLRESLLLAILCFAVWNEVISSHINSQALFEEPVLPETKISIKMPGTSPQERDTYLCTAVQLSPHKQYIVHFEPSASQKTAHHMLLYGCSLPGALLSSWDCKSGPYRECEGSQNILYAWAKDAPAKFLPKDVGFAVGGNSGINYLVLQVHYASVDSFRAGAKDYSGFILHTSHQSLPYGGGIYLLWAYSGSIPPETAGIHVDMACKYNKPETMFAFAYRTHAHRLAKVITGYRVRSGVWTLLGKGDPQAPQAFYPMDKTYDIKKGDILVARCTYDSRGHNLHGVVHMGSSGHDEMCNFYIMYYSNADRLEYSGGDCGEQDHPEIFKHFPSGSDTPLVHSSNSKASSDQATSPVHSSAVTPEEQSTQATVYVQVSSDSKSRDRNHGMDISDLEFGEKESPKSSTKSNQDMVFVEVSKGMVSSSKEMQPVLPSVTPTSEPDGPVTQARDNEEHIPELHVVSDWPSLTAIETSKLGQVTGVSLDSKEQVIVFHRASRIWDENTFDSADVFHNADTVGTIKEHTVWILDSVSGKVKGFWGRDMFYLPHGLTVDHEDNLWLTDVGSHQVFKFSPLGSNTQRLLALGDKLVPGSGSSRFCKPTSVAVDRSGEFFVADGYCNSRILKFSATGKLLSSWGEESDTRQGSLAPGSFLVPHSLALDQANHTLYVADRENGRVQSFNSISGTFLDEIKLPAFGGVVYAVAYSQNAQGGVLYVVNGPNRDQDLYVPIQGFTIRISDKAVLQTWPSNTDQALSQPHDLVSSVDGSDVFVVEIGPNRLWKLSSKPPTDSSSAGAATTPLATVPVLTSEQINEGSHQTPMGKSPDQAVDSKDVNSKQDGDENKPDIDTSSHQDSAGTDQAVMTEYSGDGNRSPSSPSYHQNSTGLGEVNDTGIEEPSKKSVITWVNVTDQSRFIPKGTGTGKNSSISGPQEDSVDGSNSDNITAGIIPALIILSVLAVPIVFLLIISITLRLRAYHRDKHSQMNGFHGSRKNLSVGRTRGWWSYMNCCDRQKYKFNRVTLQDFYSDSDSDGV